MVDYRILIVCHAIHALISQNLDTTVGPHCTYLSLRYPLARSPATEPMAKAVWNMGCRGFHSHTRFHFEVVVAGEGHGGDVRKKEREAISKNYQGICTWLYYCSS